MKVVILGAGVIGVTTAYYLARGGHEVTVLEQHAGAAQETSFANAGEISPGYAAPWASPGLPAKALKWLLMRHGPLVLKPRFDPAMWIWAARTLMNCSVSRYSINKSRMLRLALYSLEELRALRVQEGLEYDQRSQGTLQLFRTQQQLDHCGADTELLREHGVPYKLLDRAGCVHVEPALARVSPRVAGGLRLPGDETGDCYKFTLAMVDRASMRGAKFSFGVRVDRLISEGDKITGVVSNAGTEVGDAYVIALGSYSSHLLRAAHLSPDHLAAAVGKIARPQAAHRALISENRSGTPEAITRWQSIRFKADRQNWVG